MDPRRDPYNWENTTGWKSYRMLRPCRGMYYDVRRRLPYYWSDIKDGFTYRAFAATVRMYFVNLLPAIAFILDMNRKTGGFFGINEALFSSALAAMVFSLLSCQPLTIVGITGLISLFNYTIYDIAENQHITDLYPEFLAWVAIWAAITHWIASVGNLCDYMRFITDFSSNAFGMYVGIIYMIKGVEELVAQFTDSMSTAGFLSVVVALCYWATVYALELLPRTVVFTPTIRKFLSDYAYPICTLSWTGFVHISGPLQKANVLKLTHTRAFYPTVDRSWLIHFWNLPVKWVFVALPIGILLTLLFYYDHNVSSLGAQARQYPLKKPAGFHWDFFLLGCTSFISGIIGIPLPNGLVPQAPVHTDSLTNYKDKLVITNGTDENGEIVEHRRKSIVAESVVEQRLSHFLMGLAIIGTMTGPLLVVLHTMPRCLFAGVFFVVGWGSIEGNGITQKAIFLLSERRFIDPVNPLLRVPRKKIMLFLILQILGVGFSVAISQTIGAIGFPVIIISLIPLRWVIMPRLFTRYELGIMDALTADSDVVLSSLGGKPEMPEVRLERESGGSSSPGGSGTGSDKERGLTDEEETAEGKRLRQLEQSGRADDEPFTSGKR
ncbi:HCO3 transporter family-domain-containing protein [Delphinella strobiligena]|nr:HCO3 transporter family-domain-containing protein [Delphinella strobiligena]